MKRHTYPSFLAIGMVEIFEHGATRHTARIQASAYINYQCDAATLLVRDAKYKLELLGTPKDRIDALFFEYVGTTECHALNAKGVRQVFGEHVEAEFDCVSLKKRDLLIRQRRAVPYDHSDMVAIYGPKVAAPAQEAVAA